VRIRIRRVRIHSRYEITLAIPDLDTNDNLGPDPQKVAVGQNRIAIADPDPEQRFCYLRKVLR
jgi:hypothetical protein